MAREAMLTIILARRQRCITRKRRVAPTTLKGLNSLFETRLRQFDSRGVPGELYKRFHFNRVTRNAKVGVRFALLTYDRRLKIAVQGARSCMSASLLPVC